MTRSVSALDFEELSKEMLSKLAPAGKWIGRKWKGHPELRRRIETTDLSPHETIDEKIWALKNNEPSRPVCAVCGGKVNLKCQITGYRRTCSLKCAANDPQTKAKTAATRVEKYDGCWAPTREWENETEKDEHYARIYEKCVKTLEENYGVRNVYQLPSVKETIKETCVARYGVENPQQNEVIKAATAATVMKRYGGAYHPEKVKNTLMERYGVENPMSCPEIAARSMQTRIERYGPTWFMDQMKKATMEKYGVEYPQQSPEIRQRTMETCIKRYGFPYPAQNPEVHKKMVHTSPRTKQFTLPSGTIIDLQGYEPQVLRYIFSNCLFTEQEIVFPVPRITRPEGAIYTPDFWIPKKNLLIEVKSTYTWFHEKHAALARRKAQAAKDAGYKIEVWIWDDKLKSPTVVTDFTL